VRPPVVDDFTAFDPARYAYAEIMRSQGLRSAVNVPIDASGQRIGSVHVNHRHPGFYGPTDLAVASALAAQAGTVIERVRLVAAEHAQLHARVEAEARFHALVDAAPDAVITADDQGRMILINRRVEELFGYPQEAVLGQPISMLMPERFRAAHTAGITLAQVSGVLHHSGQPLTVQGLRQDGSEFPLELSLSSWQMRDKVFFSGIIRDITARQEAEQALAQRYREAEQARGEARAILDATEEAMLLVAPDGHILSANRRLAALFPMGEQELVGRHVTDLQAHLARIFSGPGDAGHLMACLSGGECDAPWDLHQRWLVERDLALTCRPVTATDGSQLGRLFAFRDVTQDRALIRLKDQFVAHVSHELRTPLTSIKGYADLLLAGDVGKLSRQQREFLDIIKRNADREVTLVNDLLDLSSIGAGKLDLTLVPLDLCRLLAGVVILFRPQLAAKRQVLTTDLPATLPEVLGDANRLVQGLHQSALQRPQIHAGRWSHHAWRQRRQRSSTRHGDGQRHRHERGGAAGNSSATSSAPKTAWRTKSGALVWALPSRSRSSSCTGARSPSAAPQAPAPASPSNCPYRQQGRSAIVKPAVRSARLFDERAALQVRGAVPIPVSRSGTLLCPWVGR